MIESILKIIKYKLNVELNVLNKKVLIAIFKYIIKLNNIFKK
jgi:hypothetical protein